jgi:hypothetical protein
MKNVIDAFIKEGALPGSAYVAEARDTGVEPGRSRCLPDVIVCKE